MFLAFPIQWDLCNQEGQQIMCDPIISTSGNILDFLRLLILSYEKIHIIYLNIYYYVRKTAYIQGNSKQPFIN